MPKPWVRQTRAYARRSLFDLYRQSGVVFVHVPRSAGTSVSIALYSQMIGHNGLAELQMLAPHDVMALPRFTVVRNPWDRAVSAWSLARAGRGIGDNAVAVREAEQYRVPAFETFERFVFEWLEPRDLSLLDSIFQQQARFLRGTDDRLHYDHVGKFEALGDTEAWLSRTLGRAIRFPRTNAASQADYREHYTPALRDAIARIYAADVELLGYDF